MPISKTKLWKLEKKKEIFNKYFGDESNYPEFRPKRLEDYPELRPKLVSEFGEEKYIEYENELGVYLKMNSKERRAVTRKDAREKWEREHEKSESESQSQDNLEEFQPMNSEISLRLPTLEYYSQILEIKNDLNLENIRKQHFKLRMKYKNDKEMFKNVNIAFEALKKYLR